MHRTRRRRRHFTPEERSRLTREAHRLRSSGLTLQATAKELGVVPSSLRLWMMKHPPTPTLRPVRLVPPADPSPGPLAAQTSVTTPDGFRFDGLTIESALVLVEKLR